MMPYFPFEHDTYRMSMGVQPLAGRPLIEVDPGCYHHELALKHAALHDMPHYYARALPGSESAQWEALALVLRDLVRNHRQHFGLEIAGDRWTWHNRLLGHTQHFCYGDPATLPHAPLDWVGRQVQEDLLLLSGDEAAVFPLVAGQLCFANRWSLDEKIGKSFMDIHEPVPLFAAQVGRSSHLLMARLKPERPVWRLNWAIKSNDQLDLTNRFAEFDRRSKHGVTPENAGERCWLRVEWQGLVRLPHSGTVLFTIHTYQTPIAAVAAEAEYARRMLGVLRSTPAEIMAYKGIAPFAEALGAYLEHALRAHTRA